MLFSKYIFLLLASTMTLLIAAGCGSSLVPAGLTNGKTIPVVTGVNVMTMTINGSTCSASNYYPNKPCVNLVICTPGTATCQTLTDILVDTGSSGLRVFKSLLSVSPTQISSGGLDYAECAQFGDGSSIWGPVQTADLVLGSESAVQVPIHVIDSTFSNGAAANCSGASATPAAAGYNGILGVGLFSRDCGSTCVTRVNNRVYYACNGTSCSSSTISLVKQVQNPVAAQSIDNNGVILQLPAVDIGGAPPISGYLILGIGTRSNNSATGVTAYSADSTYGEFYTTFNNQTLSSFIDSGSNVNFIPSVSSLPDCASQNASYSGAFCPGSTVSLSAINTGYSGSPNSLIPFYVGNFIDLVNNGSGNKVFLDLAVSTSSHIDWGLSFHVGRNVFVGINGTTSSLGTGPYWAY